MFNKQNKIPLFFVVAFYFILLFLLIYFERNQDLNNFWIAIWYFIVTLASVGYGDVFPKTTEGKIIGAVFVLTSIVFLTIVISNLTNYFIAKREKKRMGHFGTDFESHIIIIGWNNFAKNIVDILVNVGKKVAIILETKDDIDKIYSFYDQKQVFCLLTELTNFESFAKANIEKAQTIFVNLGNDTDKLIATLNIKRIYNSNNIIVLLDNPNLKETFQSAGVTFVISKEEIASQLLASYIFEPQVALFNTDILSGAKNEKDFDVQQYLIKKGNPFIGSNCDEITNKNKNETRALLVGISKKTPSGAYELIKLPDKSVIAEENDYLLFIVNSESEKYLQKLFSTWQGI